MVSWEAPAQHAFVIKKVRIIWSSPRRFPYSCLFAYHTDLQRLFRTNLKPVGDVFCPMLFSLLSANDHGKMTCPFHDRHPSAFVFRFCTLQNRTSIHSYFFDKEI